LNEAFPLSTSGRSLGVVLWELVFADKRDDIEWSGSRSDIDVTFNRGDDDDIVPAQHKEDGSLGFVVFEGLPALLDITGDWVML
jgi:hypothetical protein